MKPNEALAKESEKLSITPIHVISKAISPTYMHEVTGWDAETTLDLSGSYPLKSLKHPPHLRKYSASPQEGLYTKTPQCSQKSQSKPSSLPDVVSIYEISKVSPKYKQFFENTKPCKKFKKDLRFPAINNKSLLSVYLTDDIGKNKKNLKYRSGKRNSVFEGLDFAPNRPNYKIKETTLASGRILTIYSPINPFHKCSKSIGISNPMSPSL